MDWNDLRHALAVARRGSIRGAAEDLGVSHSTVARRVAALEHRLSTRLFDRSRDGFTLTAAGQALVPRAERMEAEMAALTRDLEGRDERMTGRIRITCCDTWVSDLLMGPLADLCTAHPGLDLHLAADTRSVDLTKREADVAIRILARGATPPEHLIATPLVPLTVAGYVSRAHVERLDPSHDGSHPRWLTSFDDDALLLRLLEAIGLSPAPRWGRFSDLGVLTQAAGCGLGLALLPCYVADPDPTLQRLGSTGTVEVADLWLLSHPDLRATTRLQEARACITTALRSHDALFRGALVHPSRAETVHDGAAAGPYREGVEDT